MTAEIVVFNKSAIALAADSAVTISSNGRSQKTYTVNKLFTLSKYHPVGIMVFGGAELAWVPWETTIKVYRAALEKRSFDTINEYAADFVNFIENHRKLFSEERQLEYSGLCIEAMISTIKRMAFEAIKEKLAHATLELSQDEIVESYESAIEFLENDLNESKAIDSVPKKLGEKIIKKCRSTVVEAKKRLFSTSGIKLSKKAERSLDRILSQMFTKGSLQIAQSGIVIAGFGDEEMFPAINAIAIHTIAENKLIFRNVTTFPPNGRVRFGRNSDCAGIIPFAQTDVVETFLVGISREFRGRVVEGLESLVDEIASEFLAGAEGISAKRKKDLHPKLKVLIQGKFEKFRTTVLERDASEVSEVVELVDVLPKDELANLAAALVELTSVKRKMSLEIETVGGPIDVAVISRGDGFVWIKRKHYFKPEMNLHFSANYFDGAKSDDKK